MQAVFYVHEWYNISFAGMLEMLDTDGLLDGFLDIWDEIISDPCQHAYIMKWRQNFPQPSLQGAEQLRNGSDNNLQQNSLQKSCSFSIFWFTSDLCNVQLVGAFFEIGCIIAC